MTEQNSLNNDDNYQSFNNPQKSQYNYLFVSGQQTQNEYNIENSIPFSNGQLNDQFLSSKRKKFQIFFSIILYILGLLLLLIDIINMHFFINNYRREYFFNLEKYFDEFIIISLILLIISILDIIIASINVYYTKKYQNSRNKCVSIILGIIFLILQFTIYFSVAFNYINYKYFCFTNIFIIIIFLNIIFSIILLFFNSKSKCCKCFN